MSSHETTLAPPPKGHNNPPVTPPKDTDLLADLQDRYPEVKDKLEEYEKALATFPKKLSLEDEDIAQALQDLLGNMKKQKGVFKAHRSDEKGPWDKLVKVVQNFFSKAEDKIDGWLEEWRPIHQEFLDLKAADARRKAEEEAERQRQAEEAARQAAEAARREAEAAAARAAEERRKEQEAREAAEQAARERAEAEAQAAAAKEKERREAAERAAREKAEKELVAENLRKIKTHLKDAETLHTVAEADEATPADLAELDGLIRPGGIISALATPVAASLLLDDAQKERIADIRTRLNDLRLASDARLTKKQRAAAEKARQEEERRQAQLAAEREAQRLEDEARAAAARAEREAAEAAAAAAKEEKAKSEKAARDAREAARLAESDAKEAGRDAKGHDTEADRAANRADRIDRRIEGSTDADFSRTRGDLGTVGSITGRWKYEIIDEAALRAVSGPLGEHFMTDDLGGACYRWMAAHRNSWDGERVEGALPGVVFFWERSTVIS